MGLGENQKRNFKAQIDYCKRRLEYLCDKNDDSTILLYSKCQSLLVKTLSKQHNFWKQRAKAFWLKDGDSNTKFFHDSMKRRMRNNRIEKLKHFECNWVHEGPELRDFLVGYFSDFFKFYSGNMDEVFNCISPKLIVEQNEGLLKTIDKKYKVKESVFANRNASG